jgi:hypothetical protein
MSGNGKHLVIYDWLTAYETGIKGMIELDEPIQTNKRGRFGDIETLRIDTMESPITSPETELIKKDEYLALSLEAKEIIEMIFNAPKEILECFMTPTYNKISKGKIKEHLVSHGWSKKQIKDCFGELKKFASNFD